MSEDDLKTALRDVKSTQAEQSKRLDKIEADVWGLISFVTPKIIEIENKVSGLERKVDSGFAGLNDKIDFIIEVLGYTRPEAGAA